MLNCQHIFYATTHYIRAVHALWTPSPAIPIGSRPQRHSNDPLAHHTRDVPASRTTITMQAAPRHRQRSSRSRPLPYFPRPPARPFAECNAFCIQTYCIYSVPSGCSTPNQQLCTALFQNAHFYR